MVLKKYILQNKLEDIAPLLEDICTEIKKYINSEIDLFSAALYEVIMNAIEHGNLNFSYETKKEYLEKHIYYEKLNEALKTDKALNTYVEITIKNKKNSIVINVKDKGFGFNHKQKIKNVNEDGIMRESGRGIAIIKSYFDEVKYNGNSVTLTKFT